MLNHLDFQLSQVSNWLHCTQNVTSAWRNTTEEKLQSIMLDTFAFNYANYHGENMQLVTHPIDTVKQWVAVKR